MRLLAVLLVLGAAVTACIHERIDHQVTPDAAGDGSAAADPMEPSPRDSDLEIVVLGVSLVVIAGPIRDVRRRRRTLKESIASKPHFS
jgi:hypothetical protein